MTSEVNHDIFMPLVDEFEKITNLSKVDIDNLKKDSTFRKVLEYVDQVCKDVNVPEVVKNIAIYYILPRVIGSDQFSNFSKRALALASLIIAAKYSCYYRELTSKIARYERSDLNARETVVNTLVNKIEKFLGLKFSILDQMCCKKLEIICKNLGIDEQRVIERYKKLRENHEMSIRAAIAALIPETNITVKTICDLFRVSKVVAFTIKKAITS